MSTNRRELLKLAGLTGIGVAIGGIFKGYASYNAKDKIQNNKLMSTAPAVNNNNFNDKDISIIGLYGAWASSFNKNKLPSFSYRRKEWTTVGAWQKAAKQRLKERL